MRITRAHQKASVMAGFSDYLWWWSRQLQLLSCSRFSSASTRTLGFTWRRGLSDFFTGIVYVTDSFSFRRPYQDKAETAPLFPPSTSMSPTMPLTSGTATINRTLLHTQQSAHSVPHPRNGNARGLANQSLNSGDSPPPTYDAIVVHDISLQRHGFFLSFL